MRQNSSVCNSSKQYFYDNDNPIPMKITIYIQEQIYTISMTYMHK